MKMDTEIDTDYQSEITCPYCGWKDRDSWDYSWGYGSEELGIECGKCEKEFIVYRDITVDYSSRKKDE